MYINVICCGELFVFYLLVIILSRRCVFCVSCCSVLDLSGFGSFVVWYWKFGKVLDLVSQKCVGAKVCLQSETKLEEMVGDIYIVVGRVSVWLMYGSFICGGIGWFVWLVVFDSIADLN